VIAEPIITLDSLRTVGRASPTKNGSYKYAPERYHTRPYRNWDKQMIQVNRLPCIKIARWIINLLPPLECTRVLQAAAIIGSRYSGTQVKMAQTKIYDSASSYSFHCAFQPEENYRRLWEFGSEACIVSWQTIVRTAISVGLQLPGAFDGVSQPSRTNKLEEEEWFELLVEANIRPQKMHLISKKLLAMYND